MESSLVISIGENGEVKGKVGKLDDIKLLKDTTSCETGRKPRGESKTKQDNRETGAGVPGFDSRKTSVLKPGGR